MSLYEKIYKVMCDTEAIEKNLVVGNKTNSYKAIGEKEVLNMIKPLFKKYKLIIFPVNGEITEQNSTFDSTYKNETTTKTRNVTQLKVIYKIVDVETGEFEQIVGFGNGADSQDKGSGKAFTYSFKVALSKTFMLFSGEDTDNTHSDDIGGSKGPKENDDTEINITTQMLIEMAKSKGINETEICKKYKVSEVKYIKKDIKKEAYETYKNMGGENELISKDKAESIKTIAERKGINQASICANYNVTKFEQMTFEVWRDATEKLELRPDKKSSHLKEEIKKGDKLLKDAVNKEIKEVKNILGEF